MDIYVYIYIIICIYINYICGTVRYSSNHHCLCCANVVRIVIKNSQMTVHNLIMLEVNCLPQCNLELIMSLIVCFSPIIIQKPLL